MIESLYIGATGLNAHKTEIDVISNNLANVNTAGYKKSTVVFEELMYQSIKPASALASMQQNDANIGYGINISGTDKDFSTGQLKRTDRPLDMAIQGNGFFEVTLPNGEQAYSRVGSMSINAEGYIQSSSGNPLTSALQIPSDAKRVVIDQNGEVFVELPNEEKLLSIGQIELANFINPSALNPLGENLYQNTEASGAAFYGYPGENGMGTVAQGFVEASNVQLVEEMTNLVVAQRAYQLGARIIQAADQVMSITNDLRR